MLDTDTYRTHRRRPPSRFFPLEAEELLRSGQVENATELCKRGLIYFPDNISGYAVLAQAYALMGQGERALNVLENGYRRTGAQGLNTLRLLMHGVSLQTLLEQPTAVTGIATAEEPEATIAGGVADTSTESEELTKAEEASSQPVVVADTDEAVPSPLVPEIAEPEVEPALGSEAESPTEEAVEAETAIAVSESQAPELVEEVKIDVDAAPMAAEGHEAESVGLESIETGEEEADSGGLGAQARETIVEAVEEPEKPEAESREREVQPARREKERKIGHGGLSLHSGTKISRLSSSNLRLIPGLEFAPLRRDDELKIKIAPLINELPPNFSLTFDPIIPGLSATPAEESFDTESTPEEPVERTFGNLPEEAPWISAPTISHENFEKRAIGIEESMEESLDEVDLFPEIPLMDDDSSIHHTSEPNAPHQNHGAMTPLEELARRLETARIPIVEEEEERTYDSPAFEPSIISDTIAAILAGQGAYAEAIKAYQTLARTKPERREEYDRKIADIRRKMLSEEG